MAKDVKVKICGLTNLQDAGVAVDAEADFLGFVNAPMSPRFLEVDEIAGIIKELEPPVPTVLVTHSQAVEDIFLAFEGCGADVLQLHAALHLEEYRYIGKRIHDAGGAVIANISIPAELEAPTPELIGRVKEVSALADDILLDTKAGKEIGGTGVTYDWSIAAELKKHSKAPVIIAGGLGPDNVSKAVAEVHPFAVDVSSGVESRPGKKDEPKVRAFIKNAKSLG